MYHQGKADVIFLFFLSSKQLSTVAILAFQLGLERGVLPEKKIGGGVPPASQNSYTIYDLNLPFFLYDLTKNSQFDKLTKCFC